MKRITGKLLIIAALTFFISNILVVGGLSQSNVQNAYEAYYLHLKAYPSGAPSWGEALREVQGLTHDDSNWYITATERSDWNDPDLVNCYLWKIPVKVDLSTNVDSDPNVTKVDLYQFPPLWGSSPLTGYIHWGDLDHYRYNGIDYLVVPVTRPKVVISRLPRTAVVIFRAADLSLVGFAGLSGSDRKGQKDVGWCAVDPTTGDLYTSNDSTCVVLRYEIPWSLLPASGYLGQFSVTFKDAYNLRDGFRILWLHNMQGGEFTPSGELLYISNGRGYCKGFGAPDAGDPNDGISVFLTKGRQGLDTKSWSRIKHSTNRCYESPGVSDCTHALADYFDFTFDFGCGWFETHSDQPEGLTIWDLDDGRAPNINGQLHVLTAAYGLAGNNASLEHFSGKLHVGLGWLFGPPSWTYPLPGTLIRPFRTVSLAFNWYPAWDGAEIVIKGRYPETGVFSKRVRITSRGGAAIIGQ